MKHAQHNAIVNFIWNIADDVLRDVYRRHQYGEVILPMTVIRRLDVLLEKTKEDILQMKKQLDFAQVINQDSALCAVAKQKFYNTSQFTLKKLLNDPKQIHANFTEYLNGFSANVGEIIKKFGFYNHLDKLAEGDVLYYFVEKFVDPEINLSPFDVLNADGSVKLPALSNHGMGTVFEELLRRFSDVSNEEAGEHFTPRDVVQLMTKLIFTPIKDDVLSTTYLVYDCACGTGGMLTEAEKTLQQLAKENGKKEVSIHLYGQESSPETYAICKADLLIKGEEEQNIAFGSTLSSDAFPTTSFDFMLANPPYGKSWKTDLDRLCGGNKKDISDSRFVVSHDGDAEFPLVTRSSDGQLMFLVNMLSKMKDDTPLGSRIATVHNGSALFTGDAGQGESNIRQWIIENDWLEAIIGVPENMFYNTGIATYIWVLTNRKPDKRKGKIQLIDATDWKSQLRKNLGKKNCYFSEEQIERIVGEFLNFEETENSKIFDAEDFGYWKMTIERPLRLQISLSAENLANLREVCEKENETPLANLVERFAEKADASMFNDYNQIWRALKKGANEQDVKLTARREKLFREYLCEVSEIAEPVVAKRIKIETEAEAIYGVYAGEKPKSAVIYEADAALRDYENVPLKDDIEDYFRREVLPHVADAWIDPDSIKKGYEISFTKYFYRYEPLRDIKEISAELLTLENKTEGLLKEIVAQA